ncbi:hypothetical protein DL766_005605 [Monosporascus sp. MC13-8B]|nr:hypothetical protein DL763_009226 [Monosporascus cannonballus]RYP28991.1 hypothetical protein DL766_005605 [Monosporascus sp. MC13-8B]
MSSSKKATEKKAAVANGKQSSGVDLSALVAKQTRDTLAVIFAWRLINTLCVRTFFQPDEYFQALEPAWQLVYGEGSGAWLTWEWVHGLRSSLHPAIFALGYFIVENVLGPLTKVKAKWLLAAPRVMQTGFAALGDWYTWRLAERLYGQNSTVAWSVLAMTLLNPWQWYTSTRTFSNCFESTLTSMALYYFPWELLGVRGDTSTESKSESEFCSGPLFRTKDEINWFTLDGKSPFTRQSAIILFREAVLCGSLALCLSLLADRQYYGDWTFPPFTWMRFNVVHDLAVFYGENDWHYYLSQGIPLLCTTITPFTLMGLFKSNNLEAISAEPVITGNAIKALSFAVLTTISSLSFVSHKEVRFLTPLSPALHILAAPHATSLFTTALETAGTCPPPALGWKRKTVLLAGIIVNIVIGGYLSYFHAAAPISVMTYLRTEFERIHPKHLAIPRPEKAASDEIQSELFALFLTPCHATPWRSHLVYPALRARGLTCDPPLNTPPGSRMRKEYQDETSRFYADPVEFLRTLWPRDKPGEDMARYIVGFEGVEDALLEYFEGSGPGARHGIHLKEVWSEWNGLFTDDERKSGRLVVWATGFYDDEMVY